MSILIFYSLYLIFKRRAPFKFIHHTLRYVLLFFFAYNKSDVNDMIVQMALLAIILFSVAGELVSWPIEETPDKIVISPSGRKRSYIVAVISIVVASLLSVYVLNGLFEFPIRVGSTYLSFYLIPFLIVTSVLVKPIIKAVQEGQANLHYSHGKRELVIMTTIFLIISTISAVGAENVMDVEINSESYVLDSEIWTMIAGKESWDVPWIFFDYVDQDDFHYLLLHKNGILELGRVVNGKEKIYLASAKTDLSPFQPHNFHITLNKTTIFINLDDKYQLITTRNPPYRNIRVKITRSYLSFIGDVKITTEGLS